MSIKTKILLVVCPVIIVSIGVTTAIISMMSAETAQQLAHRVADETAQYYGLQVKAELEGAMEYARLLALAFWEFRQAGDVDRGVLDKILVVTLRHDPDLFGVWTIWEPNSYDNRDQEYVNAEGHDHTGQVNSWWYYGDDENGGIVVEPVVDWEANEWYTIPQDTGKEVVYGPYVYTPLLSGKDIVLIEAIQPIMHEGRFYGVAAVEYRMNVLQEQVRQLKVLESGYSALLANNGKFVAHPDQARIGESVGTSPEARELMEAVRAGKRYEQTIPFDDVVGGEVYRISSPIILGETGTPWAFVVNIPTDVVTASATRIRNWILAIGGVSGLVVIAILMMLIDRLVKPIVRMSNKLKETVSRQTGRVEELDVDRRDEVGQLALSFNTMASHLNKSREELESVNREIRELNEELEQRVLKRTDQLSRANADLHEAKDRAETANRAKSVFLANMSHELRTPLNAILGYSQLMRRESSLSDSQKGNLQTINRSGEHLLSLINDVLEISKIEADRITVNQTTFDLHGMLNDLESMFRLRADAKGLQLTIERQDDVPRYVQSDESKLRQVLINLLGNAVKFTQQGGVALRTRVGGDDSDRLRLRVEVEDTGMGIAENELDKVFQPFAQTTSGRAAEGTGLGLAISREHARRLSGNLTFTSRQGEGSVFRLEIQIAERGPQDLQIQPETRRVVELATDQDQPRILVVDDKEANRQVLAQILESVGFQTREAVNGEEAIRVFQQWSPDAILTDIRMPVMDGLEATRRIKALPGGAETPIVAVSASVFEEDRAEILAAGCDDFLRKPVREEQVFETFARHLRVHYVYEESTEKPEPPQIPDTAHLRGQVLALPSDLQTSLHVASIELNAHRVEELLDQVAEHDSELASALLSLTRNFAYPELQQVFAPRAG